MAALDPGPPQLDLLACYQSLGDESDQAADVSGVLVARLQLRF